jgi:peptide deformylase
MHSILPAEQNPALREAARDIPLDDIASPRIQSLIREMKRLLDKEKFGVALAAPQLGEPLKLFIVSGRALARDARNAPDEPEHEEEKQAGAPPLPDQVYINPELTKLSRGRVGKHEGCLSIRGKWGVVPRAEKATVRAYDEHGTRFTRGASGFLAHVFQHEMDHLSGVLYTDKATELYDEDPEEAADDHDE